MPRDQSRRLLGRPTTPYRRHWSGNRSWLAHGPHEPRVHSGALASLVSWGHSRGDPESSCVTAEGLCDQETPLVRELLTNMPSHLQRHNFFTPKASLGRTRGVPDVTALECLWAEMSLNLTRGRHYFYLSKAVCCENVPEQSCQYLLLRRYAETPDRWRIISQKHIFISPFQTIPKDRTCIWSSK